MNKPSLEKRVKTFLKYGPVLHELFNNTNSCKECHNPCCKQDYYCPDGFFDDWPDYEQFLFRFRVKNKEFNFNPNGCDYLSDSGCLLEDLRAHNCFAYSCCTLTSELLKKGVTLKEDQLFTDLENILKGVDFNESVQRMESFKAIVYQTLSKDSINNIKNRYSELMSLVDESLSQPVINEMPVEYRVKTYLMYANSYYTFFKTIDFCSDCEEICCKHDYFAYNGLFEDNPKWTQILFMLGLDKFGKPNINPDNCSYLGENGCRLKYLKPITCLAHVCGELKQKLLSLGIKYDEEAIKNDFHNILSGHDFKSSVLRMQNRVNEINLILINL